MRKEYGQAVRKLFDKAFLASNAEWEAVAVKSMYLFPGERAYRRVASPTLHLWCLLVPDQKLDRFTVEVGWSRLARFPELSMRPSSDDPESGIPRDEYVCRLGRLAEGRDVWWTVGPFRKPATPGDLLDSMKPVASAEATQLAAPKVEQAVAAWMAFAVPYLARVNEFSREGTDRAPH